jgi:Cys-rich repeat protein
VVQVSWNDPGNAVPTATETFLETWWPAIISPQGGYLAWLTEYDTTGLNGQDGQPGSNQAFTAATYGGHFAITPSVANQGTTVDNSAIGSELVAQITAGSLPAPTFDANGNNNTLYMIDFPVGVSITLTFGGQTSASCSAFCGYHFGTQYQGKQIEYGVHPDLTQGTCNSSCSTTGAAGQPEIGSVHSHELVEAMTDPQIFLEANIPPYVRPGGWDAPNCSEIGDECNFDIQQLNVGGTNYPVQGEWDNARNDCEIQGPVQTCTTSAQCTNPLKPACKTGTCQPCGGDADCAGNPAGGACQPSGACGQCSATNHAACVAPHPVCDTTSGNCVACLANTDCSGSTPICDTGTHTCRACTAGDCSAPTPVCDTTGGNAGKCVECTANTNCSAPTPVCNTTTNRCVQCASSTDCSGAQHVCDTTTGTCVACVTNTDCTGQVCDTTNHTCVQCVNDSECNNPTPICNTSGDAGLDTCRACANNGECAGSSHGAICAGGSCVQCGTSGDCPTGQVCDPNAHTCSTPPQPDAGGGGDGGTRRDGGGGGTTDGGGGGSGDGGGNGDQSSGSTSGCAVSAGGGTPSGLPGLAGLLLGVTLALRRRAGGR